MSAPTVVVANRLTPNAAERLALVLIGQEQRRINDAQQQLDADLDALKASLAGVYDDVLRRAGATPETHAAHFDVNLGVFVVTAKPPHGKAAEDPKKPA